MKIDRFTRANLKTLDEAIVEAVQPVAEKFGIQIKRGSGTFTPTDYKVKLICAVQNLDGTYETPERTDFKQLAPIYGLTADDIDMTFKWNEEKYNLIGIRARSRKFPFIGKRIRDGKRFKFGVDAIKFAKAQQNE